jgi:hypothetical protein
VAKQGFHPFGRICSGKTSVPALAFAVLVLSACEQPRPPDSAGDIQAGGYRFELFTRQSPEAEPERAVTGVFYLADKPFDDRAILERREALQHRAPLDEVERHLLQSGVSNFCFAAIPDTAVHDAASFMHVPLAFSVARRNAQMVEVLMYNGADWSYSWTLGSGRDGVSGRVGEQMWELYEDEIRVTRDASVTVDSCFDLAEQGYAGSD